MLTFTLSISEEEYFIVQQNEGGNKVEEEGQNSQAVKTR